MAKIIGKIERERRDLRHPVLLIEGRQNRVHNKHDKFDIGELVVSKATNCSVINPGPLPSSSTDIPSFKPNHDNVRDSLSHPERACAAKRWISAVTSRCDVCRSYEPEAVISFCSFCVGALRVCAAEQAVLPSNYDHCLLRLLRMMPKPPLFRSSYGRPNRTETVSTSSISSPSACSATRATTEDGISSRLYVAWAS